MKKIISLKDICVNSLATINPITTKKKWFFSNETEKKIPHRQLQVVFKVLQDIFGKDNVTLSKKTGVTITKFNMPTKYKDYRQELEKKLSELDSNKHTSPLVKPTDILKELEGLFIALEVASAPQQNPLCDDSREEIPHEPQTTTPSATNFVQQLTLRRSASSSISSVVQQSNQRAEEIPPIKTLKQEFQAVLSKHKTEFISLGDIRKVDVETVKKVKSEQREAFKLETYDTNRAEPIELYDKAIIKGFLNGDSIKCGDLTYSKFEITDPKTGTAKYTISNDKQVIRECHTKITRGGQIGYLHYRKIFQETQQDLVSGIDEFKCSGGTRADLIRTHSIVEGRLEQRAVDELRETKQIPTILTTWPDLRIKPNPYCNEDIVALRISLINNDVRLVSEYTKTLTTLSKLSKPNEAILIGIPNVYLPHNGELKKLCFQALSEALKAFTSRTFIVYNNKHLDQKIKTLPHIIFRDGDMFSDAELLMKENKNCVLFIAGNVYSNAGCRGLNLWEKNGQIGFNSAMEEDFATMCFMHAFLHASIMDWEQLPEFHDSIMQLPEFKEL